VVPGIIVLAITSGSVSTAVGVNMDMTEGIVDRFRTMAIAQSSVLTGHVVGGTLVTTAGALLVAAVGALVGFRPIAGMLDWLAVIGMIAVAAFAITWISVALGLQARNPESASNIVLPWRCCRYSAVSLSGPSPCRAGSAGSRSTSRSHL
jgi:ABC-2 type transport system permease protein